MNLCEMEKKMCNEKPHAGIERFFEHLLNQKMRVKRGEEIKLRIFFEAIKMGSYASHSVFVIVLENICFCLFGIKLWKNLLKERTGAAASSHFLHLVVLLFAISQT